MPRGRKNAPRDPVTGRFISVDAMLAQAAAWYSSGSATVKGGPPPVQTPHEFAVSLMKVVEETPRGVEDVVEDSCKRVVIGAKANILRTAPVHNAGAYKGLDYEVNNDGRDIWGEVGYNPKKNRAAYLGNLLEFGGPGINGDPSPAHYDLANALRAEMRTFENELGDFGEAALETYWSADPGIKKRWNK